MNRSSSGPRKSAKQSSVCSILCSPTTFFAIGILLFGFCLGCTFAYLNCICTSDSNFTKVMRSKHPELVTGIARFLQLVEEVESVELLSPYSEIIIRELSNNIRKGITDLEDLRESTKPKVRRRPPLETWNLTRNS